MLPGGPRLLLTVSIECCGGGLYERVLDNPGSHFLLPALCPRVLLAPDLLPGVV